jgi:hypothetical protein
MIFSNLLNIQNKNKVDSEESEVLFIYRGIEKTEHQIDEVDRLKLADLNHQKVKILENAALKQYFSDQATMLGMSVESAAAQLLKWEPVTDSEVNRFYFLNKEEIQKPFFEVKSQIRRNIELKQAAKARETLLEKLKMEGNLAILPKH